MQNLSLIAWISIIIALAAWASVVVFSLSIQNAAAGATARAGDLQTASDKQALALKMHTLARDTSHARTTLRNILNRDPLAIADILSQAGTDAGVALRVSDAKSQGVATSPGSPRPSAAAANLPQTQAIGFTVEADGSFGDLVRAAAFLESLPVPSRIDELDLQREHNSEGAPSASWHMRVNVRILTNSNVSS